MIQQNRSSSRARNLQEEILISFESVFPRWSVCNERSILTVTIPVSAIGLTNLEFCLDEGKRYLSISKVRHLLKSRTFSTTEFIGSSWSLLRNFPPVSKSKAVANPANWKDNLSGFVKITIWFARFQMTSYYKSHRQ